LFFAVTGCAGNASEALLGHLLSWLADKKLRTDPPVVHSVIMEAVRTAIAQRFRDDGQSLLAVFVEPLTHAVSERFDAMRLGK
jgi:hypothetical protein